MNDEQVRQHLVALRLQAEKRMIPWEVYFNYRDYYEEAGYDIDAEREGVSLLFTFLGILVVLAVLAKVLDSLYF